ncbi:MAG: hypothetical protein IRZ15_03415 [Bryobacteraceae bacterium]|jgi:hypothetical protein|nr:hypothetical protein [Bryobacteraceae bacterium]
MQKLGCLLFIGSLCAYSQVNGVRAAISPIPPYPLDGSFRLDMQDQYVFLKAPGEYVVSYPGALDPVRRAGSNGRIEFPVTFPAQVAPVIDVQVATLENGEYLYSYTVTNRGIAAVALDRVALRMRSIEALESVKAPVNTPGWNFTLLRNAEEHIGPVWKAMSPQQTRNGTVQMSFRTPAKPGIVEMVFQGSPVDRSSVNDLPAPVKASIERLDRGTLASVSVLTVGPKYAPEVNPFAVAVDLHAQAAMWSEVRGTPYTLEVRDRLRAYMDAVAPFDRPVEEIATKPEVHTSARPLSYEDVLLQTVLTATLGTGK